MNVCKICKNTTGNKSFIAHEMMFGYRDEFKYFECAKCGCVQIKEIPDDLSKYYPEDYYSFQSPYYLKENFLKYFLRRQRAKYCLNGKDIIGMLLSRMYGMPKYYDWFKRAEIKFESKILDVGCGDGHLLSIMQRDGFSNLLGVDPFIIDNIFCESGIKIFKKDMSEIKQQFDFIMLHHSFEHMPQPLSTFKQLFRLLIPNKYVLVRIPVASSFAWRKYGVNWVQLDAPRHLFLHTIKSIQILAEQVNFQISDIIFCSTEFQFWGSEQYLKDIPLKNSKSYSVNPQKSIFSKEQIESFKSKAIELNKKNDGDTACFFLYKT
jgi:SAM-dependent methyltransferase